MSSSSETVSLYASSSEAPPLCKSRWRSSRCCATSSVSSDSADAVNRRSANRARTTRLQSAMLDSGDAADERDEVLPTLLLRTQRISPSRRQAVVAASALLCLLHPPANDPPVFFEPVEQRLQGGDMKSQRPAGSDLDQFGDVVPVSRLILQQRQDQQLRAALFPLRLRHARRRCVLRHAGHRRSIATYTSVPYIGPHRMRRLEAPGSSRGAVEAAAAEEPGRRRAACSGCSGESQ